MSLRLTSNAASITTVAAGGGGSPTWFTSAADKAWIAVASVGTINVAFAGQVGISGATNGGICDSWNPACVDQVRGEYLMVGNGGHDDYRGNEVYALALRIASPTWYRLLDHSPDSAILAAISATNSTSNTTGGQGQNPAGYAAMFTDGRRRAHHGWYDQIFHNGYAWNVNQGSPTGVGNSTSHAWKFNRNFAGIPTAAGGTPLAWTNNVGPWTWLGTSDTGNKASGAISAYSLGNNPAVALDPVTGKIWYARPDQGNWFAGWGSLDTATEVIQGASAPQPWQQALGQSCVCVDPAWDGVAGDPNNTCRWRFFVFSIQNSGNLAVLNLKAANPLLFSAWTQITPSNPSALNDSGGGMVYHKASRSIIAANPVRSLNGNLTKVRVPTNADGTYNAAGTWTVSTVTTSGANPSTGSSPGTNGGGYVFGKLRLMENIANGQDGIVICNGVTLPTYVCKLPATEIS